MLLVVWYLSHQWILILEEILKPISWWYQAISLNNKNMYMHTCWHILYIISSKWLCDEAVFPRVVLLRWEEHRRFLCHRNDAIKGDDETLFIVILFHFEYSRWLVLVCHLLLLWYATSPKTIWPTNHKLKPAKVSIKRCHFP